MATSQTGAAPLVGADGTIDLNAQAKAQAAALGGQALDQAKAAGTKLISGVHTYIQGGPKGVSMLCFCSALATSVVGLLNVINIFGALGSPFTYLLNTYLLLFGIVGFLLEVDVETLSKIPGFAAFGDSIMGYHDYVVEYAKFLTLLRGRGMFYVFVGSFAITQMNLLLAVVGIANCFCGVVCILMGFGVQGEVISQHLNEGYAKVSSSVTAAAAP